MKGTNMAGKQLTFDATPEELNLFISEGEEQLEILNQDILRLEQEGDSNSELLQEIFRAAHTLKGSSGAIGHQRMAKLTHSAETVLDHVRRHTLAVSTKLIDLLLQSLDVLRTLLDEVTTGVESEITIDKLCDDLNGLVNQNNKTEPDPQAAAPKESPVKPAKEAKPKLEDFISGSHIWEIDCAIDENCLMPPGRALQAYIAIQQFGKIVQSTPPADVIEYGKDLTVKKLHFELDLAAQMDGIEQALTIVLEKIPEIKVISCKAAGAFGAAADTDNTANQNAVSCSVAIDAACPMPAVRALQAIIAAGKFGTVITSVPSAEDIDQSKVTAGTNVQMQVAPNMPLNEFIDSLRNAVNHIPELMFVESEQASPETKAVEGSATKNSATAVEKITAENTAKSTAETKNSSATESETQIKTGATASHAPRMVRIDVERLDALMNLVGELVIDRTRLARIASQLNGHTDNPAIVEDLTETSRRLTRLSDDLQVEVMRSRMLPIESVFSKFPRLVRDLAQKVSKHIDFIVEGKDTELDRSVAEQISDPIIHLLRNSIDHGIETEEERTAIGKNPVGQIRLSARHEENQIVIDVEDDGHGIDPEKLKAKALSKGLISSESASHMGNREALELIFLSGFSTAEKISDISGRGVGMDIVRTNIEKLNGSITLETEIGQGTRFTVRLPLTLAIIRALLINVGSQVYALPLNSVIEALRIEAKDIRSINNHEAIELRGEVLPLIRLAEFFDGKIERNTSADAREFIVAVRWGNRRGGLIVDSLIGEQEIVIKSLGNVFRASNGVSGGAVLGDGQVAPILDIPAIIKQIINAERDRVPA